MAPAKKALTKIVKMKPQADTTYITVIKTGTCKTLNGKSKLEYALGKDADNRLHYKITKNDGGGHYSAEWIADDAIQTALAKFDPISAYPIRNLTAGRSVNTAGFILAVLLAEGSVERVPGKTRHYRYPLPKGTATNPAATPAVSSAKAPAKPAKKSTQPSKK